MRLDDSAVTGSEQDEHVTIAPSERAALLVTVRRAGSTPLISITVAVEAPTQQRLNTTSTAEALAYVGRWLAEQTSSGGSGGGGAG